MVDDLKQFFVKVGADTTLQERLYATKELVEGALIAQTMGFNVKGADILRAQVGRLIMLPIQELEDVAAGKKAKSGAQWGRAGKGYLDTAGFWLNQLIHWGCTDPAFEPQLEEFLATVKENNELQAQLLSAKSYNDIAATAHMQGYQLSGADLLRYQAIQILKLDDEKAEMISRGA